MSRGRATHASLKTVKKIFLVEDHLLIRERLKQIIDKEPDLRVCGEAEERHRALDLIHVLRPELVLSEISLRNSDGLELIIDLHASHPRLAVLALCTEEEPSYAERAIRAGARGYLRKEDISQLLPAIRRVLSGKLYLGESLIREFASRFLGEPLGGTHPVQTLSQKEMRVFELLGKGMGTHAIAIKMRVGFHTVGTYRARIKDKLKLQGRDQLLQAAITWTQGRDLRASSYQFS